MARTSPHPQRSQAAAASPGTPNPWSPLPVMNGPEVRSHGSGRPSVSLPLGPASLSDWRSKWTGQDSLPEGHCYLQQRLVVALGAGSPASVTVLPPASQEEQGESSRLRFTIPGGRLPTGPLGLRGGFGVAGT